MNYKIEKNNPLQVSKYLFVIIVLTSLLIGLLTNIFLISETLYYNTYAEQLTIEKIESIIEQSHKWAWVGYLLVPIIYYIKFSLITLVLQTGFFFFERKVSFSIIFKAVMLAEISFLVVPMLS